MKTAKYRFGYCRDCGAKRVVGRTEWVRAAQPRCTACGGALDLSAPGKSDYCGAEHEEAKAINKQHRDEMTGRR